MFEMDQRLVDSTDLVAELPLSNVLLSKNAAWPWFLLVPRVDGANDISDLSVEDQQQFWLESNALSLFIKQHFEPTSLNVAALGNVVPQLHVHHVARYETDPAWPDPIWGFDAQEQRSDEDLSAIKQAVLAVFGELCAESDA